MGRIFGLRNRGHLDEALQEALSYANEVFSSPETADEAAALIVTATVDDLAQSLGRPEVAYDALKGALAVIARADADLVPAMRPKPNDWQSYLSRYRAQFAERLNAIVSLRNR
jgi:hypothetical protein